MEIAIVIDWCGVVALGSVKEKSNRKSKTKPTELRMCCRLLDAIEGMGHGTERKSVDDSTRMRFTVKVLEKKM